MIAVIYSGSRFADWKLAEKGAITADFKTVGINPYLQDEKFIFGVLNKNNHLINNAEKIRRIYFFGAGASSKERKEIVYNAFSSFFRYGKVTVEHDLKAAALATCEDQPGIVGILGSGANAAFFDGKKVIENNYGLGYILGDEGSANWLGRRLLKDYLNETLPDTFAEKFKKKYDLDRKQILDKVYKLPQPALFLSSFADFLAENKTDDYVKNLLMNGFDEYLKTYVLPVAAKYPGHCFHVTGTIAAGYQEWLAEACRLNGVALKLVIRKPIFNVLNYYMHGATATAAACQPNGLSQKK